MLRNLIFASIFVCKPVYHYFLQVKINGQNEEMLRAAIEQFGDKTEDEIAYGMLNFV